MRAESKFQVLIKKYYENFFSCKLFSIIGHPNSGSGSGLVVSLKCCIRKGNTDFSTLVGRMRSLFCQVLESKDLSKAGDLFSVEDFAIVEEFPEITARIQVIRIGRSQLTFLSCRIELVKMRRITALLWGYPDLPWTSSFNFSEITVLI